MTAKNIVSTVQKGPRSDTQALSRVERGPRRHLLRYLWQMAAVSSLSFRPGSLYLITRHSSTACHDQADAKKKKQPRDWSQEHFMCDDCDRDDRRRKKSRGIKAAKAAAATNGPRLTQDGRIASTPGPQPAQRITAKGGAPNARTTPVNAECWISRQLSPSGVESADRVSRWTCDGSVRHPSATSPATPCCLPQPARLSLADCTPPRTRGVRASATHDRDGTVRSDSIASVQPSAARTRVQWSPWPRVSITPVSGPHTTSTSGVPESDWLWRNAWCVNVPQSNARRPDPVQRSAASSCSGLEHGAIIRGLLWFTSGPSSSILCDQWPHHAVQSLRAFEPERARAAESCHGVRQSAAAAPSSAVGPLAVSATAPVPYCDALP